VREEAHSSAGPTTERLKTRAAACRACDSGQVVAHAAGARLAAEASGDNDAHLGDQLAVAEVLLLFVRAGGGGERRGPPLNEDWARWSR